jgi:hypothetical protein
VFTNSASFQLGQDLEAGMSIASLDVSFMAVADVNADGRPDIICANSSDSGYYPARENNTVTVLMNTRVFPAPTSSPNLRILPQSNALQVSWPSASPGWELQEESDLTTSNWLPSGYGGWPIADNGTNKSLTLPYPPGNHFFRLMHP